MEIKNEKPCIPTPLKREEINQVMTFCYNTAISYLKSKIINKDNLQTIIPQLENHAVNCTASIFYSDNSKSIRFAPEHEKAMNELDEVDFKFHLFELIRTKLDEAITNNSLFK